MKDYEEHVRRVVGEDDPERIWLQNANDAGHWEEGRLWCADKVWPDEPEDGEPTEYVRADLYVAAQAEIERLRETEEAYRELFKRSCEKTVYIAECEAEIERLREQLQKAEANEKETAGQWERMLANYHSADSRAETARNDALEEAAKLADAMNYVDMAGGGRHRSGNDEIAAAIRALKEKP